jgi:hypothetical protein
MSSRRANELLKKYGGSRLKVADALMLGKLETREEVYVEELVGPIIFAAAGFRIKEMLGKKKRKEMKEYLLLFCRWSSGRVGDNGPSDCTEKVIKASSADDLKNKIKQAKKALNAGESGVKFVLHQVVPL